MSQSQSPQPNAVIDIKASYFFLAFLLMFFKPKASINGSAPFDIRWGVTPVPVSPGRYQVEVWLPYLFLTTMGRNGAVIDVPEGGRVQVHWRSPWLVFLKGAISVQGPVPIGTDPLAGAPAASLPSPPLAGAAAPPALAAPSPAVAPPAAAATGTPAGWFPDPAARHEQRYFDGTAWTEHVVDRGAQSTDPLGV